jgi:hypothetical protein
MDLVVHKGQVDHKEEVLLLDKELCHKDEVTLVEQHHRELQLELILLKQSTLLLSSVFCILYSSNI